VLICPGGGYAFLSIDGEGQPPAQFLNTLGFDAWVLRYKTTTGKSTPPPWLQRLIEAAQKGPVDYSQFKEPVEEHADPIYPAPMHDVSTALAYIRSQKMLSQIGIWGFSAGGHLAGVALTTPENRIDFGILAYPVITLEGPYTHDGSMRNLIGTNPPAGLAAELSVQNRVSASTPPTFLFHTANDAAVPIQNALLFANAMAKNGRPFQLCTLPDGHHGLGLALDSPMHNWTWELQRFLTYSI
jgi:alpha-beta hydrolase superfamily lysophospholipase